MAKKKRQSRDQRRKAKLKERAKKRPPQVDLSYSGDRYRGDELIPLVANTEMAVNEADVRSGGSLLDRHVKAAFDYLILGMRDDSLPPFEERERVTYVPGEERDLIVYLIRRNWDDLFREWDEPDDDDKIGVLRTLLGSIQTFGTGTPQTRGYVSFVNGFVEEQGLAYEGEEEEEEEELDPLEEAGEAWVESGDDYARREFMRLAREMITAGHGDHVAEVAQYLMGRSHGEVQRELMHLAVEAQR